MLTNEELLKFFVAIINTKLFKTVGVKNFKSVNVKNTDERSVTLIGIAGRNVDCTIYARHNPSEQSVIHSLEKCNIQLHRCLLKHFQRLKTREFNNTFAKASLPYSASVRVCVFCMTSPPAAIIL